jgi:acetylglutamate kinase
VVIKLGGEVVADPSSRKSVVAELRRLVERGCKVAVCHGAGPQTAELQRRLGQTPSMVRGRRVTDAAALEVVKYTLGGQVNIDLVAGCVREGLDAIGICGAGAGLIEADLEGPDPSGVDLGYVGRIRRIRGEVIERLWSAGFVPVVSPLGLAHGESDQVLNINADTAVFALASAVRAHHLFLVTAIGGVRSDVRDPGSVLRRVTASEARNAIARGVIGEGMIPKLGDALEYLGKSIEAVHIVAPVPGCLEQTLLSPGCHGTVLLAD